MLESFGGTLQLLKLIFSHEGCDESVTMFDVSKIAGFCPHITDILLSCQREQRPDFRENEIELYCKYGSQLERMVLSGGGFTKAFLKRLVSRCPNAHFDISYVSEGVVLAIQSLGSRVFKCGVDTRHTTPSSLKTVVSKLSDVEWLSMGVLFVPTLFATPRDNLRCSYLSAGFDRPDGLCDEFVLAIARNTGGLRTFYWNGPRILSLALQALAATNSRHEKVSITGYAPTPVPVGRCQYHT